MMRQHILVTHIDQVDFDGLYNASVDYLNGGNMRWPKNATPDDKRAFFRQHVCKAMASPIGFGSVLQDEGQQYALIYGLNDHGTFHINILLVAPENGSRAYVYTGTIWNDFLRDHAIHTIVITMPIGSSLAAMLQERYPNCRPPKVVDGWWRQSVPISPI